MQNLKPEIIISMGGIAIGSIAIEKLCSMMGKQDIAQYIGTFANCMIGSTAISGAYSFLNLISKHIK